MNYYQPKTKKLYGPPELRGMGLNPDDKNILSLAGFFPVRYETPEYDKITQRIDFPDEIPFDEKTGEYVVIYVVNDITDEEIIKKNREQQEFELFRKSSGGNQNEQNIFIDEIDYQLFSDHSLTDEQREKLKRRRQAILDSEKYRIEDQKYLN